MYYIVMEKDIITDALCKQIPQLMIISKWTTEFNYIFWSMWNKNNFFHTTIFFKRLKAPLSLLVGKLIC